MTGFPGLGLLRVLRPIPTASTGDGSSRRPAGCWPGRGPPGWFPRSRLNPRQGRRPTMPLQHRHGYAAGLHRGLPVGALHRPRSSPHQTVWVRVALQPRSARFGAGGSLERRSAVGFSRTPFCLACRTRGHLAVLARPGVVRAAFRPPPRPRVRLPSASSARCDEPDGRVLSSRQVQSAPRGAPKRRSTGSGRGLHRGAGP